MTTNLRNHVMGILTPLVPGGVFYQNAGANAQHPYAVFELQEVGYEEGLSLQVMEINVMDYGEDTTAAEDIADAIQTALDHHQAVTDDFLVSIYREQRSPVPENDKQIIRRRLTFQVRLHERRSM